MNRRSVRREKLIFLLPAIFLILFIIFFRERLTHILIPIALALVFSYMMEPVVLMFRKKAHMKRNAALLLTFILMLAVLTVILVFFIPAVISNLKEIIENIPVVQQRLDELAGTVSRMLGTGRGDAAYGFMDKYLKRITNELERRILAALEGFVRSYKKIFSAFFDVITAMILTIYFLKDKEVLSNRFLSVFPYDYRKNITETFYELGKISSGFLQGQILIAVIIGILETIGLLLIKVPYPVLLGIIGGFSNLIPYFGPFIGAVPAAIAALLSSPVKALWTVILYVGVQQFDNNFLGPKIIEGKLGIHPVTTIIVVILGGELFGLFGVFIAVPLYAMLRCVVIRVYKSILRKD